MELFKNSKITSTLWNYFERMGSQGVSFLVSIVLARLLSPSEYGTVALCTVFVSFLQIFANSGFGIALVQKKDADDIDLATVFFFNLASSILLYVFSFLLAPFVAHFYHDSSLTLVIRVLSITILCSGLRNVQESLVMKQFRFKAFFFATLSGTIISGILGLILAFKGVGIWALVFQSVSSSVVNVLVLSLVIRYKPIFVFSVGRLKSLFSYGWKMLLCSMLDNVNNDLRQLIIGKKYSSSDLAFYNRGFSLVRLITANIDSSIGNVMFPSISQVQDDIAQVKYITKKVISFTCYLMMPLLFGFASCSENFVFLVFGEKWLPCIPFIKIFCLRYCVFPLHSMNLNTIKSLGRSDIYLRNAIYISFIEIVILLITMKYGVIAIAIGQAVSIIFDILICVSPSGKLFGYNYKEQFKDVMPSLLMSVLMWSAVSFLGRLITNHLLALCSQIVLGIVFYATLSKMTKNQNFNYLMTLLRKKT